MIYDSPPQSGDDSNNNNNNNNQPTVTMEDLLQTAESKPELLGEDFPVNRERILMSLS